MKSSHIQPQPEPSCPDRGSGSRPRPPHLQPHLSPSHSLPPPPPDRPRLQPATDAAVDGMAMRPGPE